MMCQITRLRRCMNIFGLLLCVFTLQTRFCLSSKVYVVYMGSKTSEDPDEILRQHHQMLTIIHGGSIEEAEASHVYSYRHGFSGFAAKLTEKQAMDMAEMPEVVSVFPNSKTRLHTTHSWDFMGFSEDESMPIPSYSTKNQEDVIIGFIDTGIWPESPSFSDHGMSPVPPKWKGTCQVGEAFNISTCNRKLIGARYYLSGYEAEEGSVNGKQFKSARDSNGHGSHTASTAAGRNVPNISFNRLGRGNARGGAALARIAVYKACWESGCFDVDLLAAFDDAIRDGIHLLSLSLGPQAPQADYFNDAISIGSFHAASHGIVVVASVGNEGFQGPGYATNLAPWMITVGASSIDRDFISEILLGDRTIYKGESLSISEMNQSRPVISASEANAGYFTPSQSSYCVGSSLNRTKARGKVLVCRHSGSPSESKLEKSVVVKEAGGIGMILIDETDKHMGIPFVIPAAIVGTEQGQRILTYINNTRKPMAQIFSAKTVLGSKPAPQVAAFSSKGPNAMTPEILKPDVTAPGLNILAAWSPMNRKLKFNILSGTSMACPHVTGTAALIKALHPSWSPAAIKSAIMTTAMVLNKNGMPITVDPDGRIGNPFDYGSGFINPSKALTPGLVYDAQPEDYRAFLCSIGYSERSLHLITKDNSTCKNKAFSTATDLNYPSITVPNLKEGYSVTRTVTNAGKPGSIYRAVVSSPYGINVTVTPKLLIFNSSGQKIKFTVNFKLIAPSKGYQFGSLTWRSNQSSVTSPLVVRVGLSNMGLLR